MLMKHVGLIVTVAAFTMGCQSALMPDTERNEALEQRVEELEQELAKKNGSDGQNSLVDSNADDPDASSSPASTERGTGSVAANEETGGGETTRPSRPASNGGSGSEALSPRVTLPRGTKLTLVLETPLSSVSSRAGDKVVARVEKAISEDGRVLLPGGTVLQGQVTRAVRSGKVKGRARLSVDFDRIKVRGQTYPVDTAPLTVVAKKTHKKDAKVVGGAAAAGALVGAILGGKKGAKKGVLLGGAAGGGAVLASRGKEVSMPSGSRWIVRIGSRLVI